LGAREARPSLGRDWNLVAENFLLATDRIAAREAREKRGVQAEFCVLFVPKKKAQNFGLYAGGGYLQGVLQNKAAGRNRAKRGKRAKRAERASEASEAIDAWSFFVAGRLTEISPALQGNRCEAAVEPWREAPRRSREKLRVENRAKRGKQREALLELQREALQRSCESELNKNGFFFQLRIWLS